MVSPLGVDVLKHAGLQFKTTAEIFVNYDALTNVSAQGGHKRGILGEFSEPGKLMEFSRNSVQPLGKIVTNETILVRLNICVKQLLTG